MNDTTLGHHWVPVILDRLRALAVLPSSGILAGQAVSSAILAELGKSTVVYNDIDVFLTADIEKEKELASQSHLEAEALRLGVPAAALDDYRKLTLSGDKTLDILGATQEGLLNLIWCKKTAGGLSGSRVIHSFDINAVEVAVDLSTNELYWSRAFEQFIRTHELQVTSLTTPERTLLRYFKKRDELAAYGDDALVVTMSARWIAAIAAGGCRDRAGLLTQKFLRLAKVYEPRYRSALIFDEGAQTLISAQALEELAPDQVNDALKHAVKNDELLGLARLIPRRIYGNALTRSKFLDTSFNSDVSEHCPSDESDEGGGTVVTQSLTWLRHEYLADHRTPKHYEVVGRLLTAHPELCGALMGLTLEEQYQCVLDLKKRVKTEGDHLYGTVESNALPSDMWNQSHRDAFFKRMDREESQTQLAHNLLTAREVAGLQIRELLTAKELRIEGAEMQHCVGGYSARIAAGRSRILSIRTKGNPCERSTAEVSLNEESKRIRVKQHYAKGNSPVSEGTRSALLSYLQEEAKRLGFSVQMATPCSFSDLLATGF
jgi:hypothetical protein